MPTASSDAALLSVPTSTDALTPPPLSPEPRRVRNYLARHWCGELSLPKSYWLNGVLGGLAVVLLFRAFAFVLGTHAPSQPLLWLISLILSSTVTLLVTVWQAVGIWRSATRYRRSEKYFWGGAAKAMTIVSLIQVVVTSVVIGGPQALGIFEILTGDARVGPHQFRILADGRTLEFSGGITFGVAQEMENFLNAKGEVRRLQLNSLGGRIFEAQRMSDMVRSRGLQTFVAENCLSACTIVFLGGEERLMLSTARFGFHQPAFSGMTVDSRRTAISMEVERLQRFGLSKRFAERANRAPPGDMWYPDKDELVREGFVTGVIPAQPGDSIADINAPATAAANESIAAETAKPEAPRPPLARIPADLLERLQSRAPATPPSRWPSVNSAK